MKNLLIAANWKSNMTKIEAKKWLEDFSMMSIPGNVELVLFAPFTLLDILCGYIRVNDLKITLGAQDVSQFGFGAYTGEISAEQIKEFADYALIGHSERRTNFNESIEVINKKIEKAKEAGLKILVCVSSLDQVKSLPDTELTIAYEPVSAIGTGNAEDPKSVFEMASRIKEIRNVNVIYGGSVNGQNIKDYLSIDNISGVLVGSASLDANSFGEIIKNAV
jgi:triosephosphate isomerase (TIM)